jgi:hypothetical protein
MRSYCATFPWTGNKPPKVLQIPPGMKDHGGMKRREFLKSSLGAVVTATWVRRYGDDPAYTSYVLEANEINVDKNC